MSDVQVRPQPQPTAIRGRVMDLRKRPTVIVAAAEPLHRSGLASLVGETCAVLETVGTARAAAQAMSRLRPALTALVLDPPLPDAPAPQACASLIGAYPTT